MVWTWSCIQSFGENGTAANSQEDVISAMAFNNSGKWFATGDGGGRIVIFEAKEGSPKEKDPCKPESTSNLTYQYLTEFQSHEPEFDYLKSMEIEERINQIKWIGDTGHSMSLLSTNDKRVKLWKVYEKTFRNIGNYNLSPSAKSRVLTKSEEYSAAFQSHKLREYPGSPANVNSSLLKIPLVKGHDKRMVARCRQNFANAHLYHIHSIDTNSDGETFISADDLHINLWNMEVNKQSFNIVDMQPDNMDELTEVITSAVFHPHHCHLFAYSSSKGSIRLADMREAALCDKHSKLYELERSQENHSFFSEIVANITDVKFSMDGNFMVTRDYMTVKLWDIRMEEKPISILNVQDSLSSKLVDLYENDCIFDRFECDICNSGDYIVSGSYSSTLRVFGVRNGYDELIEASSNPQKVTASAEPSKPRSPRFSNFLRRNSSMEMSQRKELDLNMLDCEAKVKHVLWHPNQDILAASVRNEIYMLSFTQDSNTPQQG